MLLNSEFSLATATALAQRVTTAAPSGEQRITLIYELLFSRPPSNAELTLGKEFLDGSENLVPFLLALLNTNEAIYVD